MGILDFFGWRREDKVSHEKILAELSEIRETLAAVVLSQAAINKNVLANSDLIVSGDEAIQVGVAKILEAITVPDSVPVAVVFRCSVDGKETVIEGNGVMTAKVNNKINVHVEGRDEFGNVAPFDKNVPVEWVTTGDAVVEVDTVDSTKATITSAQHTPSEGNVVQITADADVTEGSRPLVGTLQVDWIPGDAVSVDIKVDSIT